jgi:hypothetical protein
MVAEALGLLRMVASKVAGCNPDGLRLISLDVAQTLRIADRVEV